MEMVRYVEALIEERSLQPGDWIATKSGLRAYSGAAPATVNEAVKLLHDRGQVTVKPGPSGGLFVARRDPKVQLGRFLVAVGTDAGRVADAIALRDHLETMVLEEAVKHRRRSDVVELRACADRMRSAPQRREPLLPTIWALHNRIAEITPNLVLRATYCGLLQFIGENVTGLPQSKRAAGNSDEDRIRVHERLVDVIESGNLERAAEAIRLHNEGAARELVARAPRRHGAKPRAIER